jgi:hypothetical protein
MEKEFIPYEQALALQELGFDEPCFAIYCFKELRIGIFSNLSISYNTILAPLYQQAFRWFREKYGLYHLIGLDDSLENNINCDYQIINHSQSISELETSFKSYEEAELACLIKLIEIVK